MAPSAANESHRRPAWPAAVTAHLRSALMLFLGGEGSEGQTVRPRAHPCDQPMAMARCQSPLARPGTTPPSGRLRSIVAIPVEHAAHSTLATLTCVRRLGRRTVKQKNKCGHLTHVQYTLPRVTGRVYHSSFVSQSSIACFPTAVPDETSPNKQQC